MKRLFNIGLFVPRLAWNKILDLTLGPEEDFDYVSTTTPEPPPNAK